MHKKLAADLTSLAHSILQLKNKDDVFVLKQTHLVYFSSAKCYVLNSLNRFPIFCA